MRYAVGFCLLTVCCLILVYWGTLSEIKTQIDAGIRAEVDALLRLRKIKGPDALRQTIDALSTPTSLAQSNVGDPGPRVYLLTDTLGKVLAGTLTIWPVKAHFNHSSWVTIHMPAHGHNTVFDSAPKFRMRARIMLLRDGEHLLVGQSLNEIDELRNQMLTLSLLTVILIITGGLVGGWWFGRNVTYRLEQVTDAADDIMAGDLTKRIPETEHPSDEFSLLAHKLNAMLDRIELLMRNTREVTENVAHDLRSPLTRLRGAAEMALLKGGTERQCDALRNAIEQTDAIVATLNSILNIAQIESGMHVDSEHVDLTSVCHDAADMYEALAEEKGTKFTTSITKSVVINGNRQLISQAVGNLLDNAIKYTPRGGAVMLTLDGDGKDACITVSDTGPGIPVDMQEKVLHRFIRLDTSRSLSGNGLGLSLVKAVTDKYGAMLQLSDNAPGLKVILYFRNQILI